MGPGFGGILTESNQRKRAWEGIAPKKRDRVDKMRPRGVFDIPRFVRGPDGSSEDVAVDGGGVKWGRKDEFCQVPDAAVVLLPALARRHLPGW